MVRASYLGVLGDLDVEVRTVDRIETAPGVKFETFSSEVKTWTRGEGPEPKA
ncbi:MAG TPA: hypothetical protein VMR97_05330 [Acidimicrobiales bacterium]|nr:hypothetical protein [Acidimicrobiales bacterium]